MSEFHFDQIGGWEPATLLNAGSSTGEFCGIFHNTFFK